MNCLKQVAQFGIDKQIHVAGTQQELELLDRAAAGSPIGIWMFEWYWKQPGVPGVDKFVADIRKLNNGKVPTARHRFGYVSAMSLRRREPREEVDAVKLATALEISSCPMTSSCSRTRSITARATIN